VEQSPVSFEFEARFFRGLLDEWKARPRRVLVVGCGSGVEVGSIAAATGADVVGIDLAVDPRHGSPRARLVRADAEALPFRAGAFDGLYCYHVLEHVPRPERALSEARRVLAPGGVAYFGTPNKNRLVGYVGGRATGWQKVAWNARDYWQRLTGRWDNARGAHAGFTDRELDGLLRSAFHRVESVSLPYYLGKYPRLSGLWRASFRLGLARFLAPSVYFRTDGVPAPAASRSGAGEAARATRSPARATRT
jgi:SAM-dependent methyltransferase